MHKCVPSTPQGAGFMSWAVGVAADCRDSCPLRLCDQAFVSYRLLCVCVCLCLCACVCLCVSVDVLDGWCELRATPLLVVELRQIGSLAGRIGCDDSKARFEVVGCIVTHSVSGPGKFGCEVRLEAFESCCCQPASMVV